MKACCSFLEGMGMGIAVGAAIGSALPRHMRRRSPAAKAVRAVSDVVDNLSDALNL